MGRRHRTLLHEWGASEVLPRTLLIRRRQEVVGLMRLVAADEDEKALARGNHVTLLKGRIAHGAARGFGLLLNRRHRSLGPLAGACDKFLRAAAGVLHALLPL